MGKRAIVTGGATGIGYGIALRFIAEGATVIITDIDKPAGIAAESILGPSCEFIYHDVSESDDWDNVRCAFGNKSQSNTIANTCRTAGDDSALTH